MTRKQQKYSLRQIIIAAIIFPCIIAIGMCFDEAKNQSKSEKIKNESFKVYGIVEKLKPNSSKGKNFASRKDVVYLYYEKNDTVFHIIEDLPDGKIEKIGIKINDCFEIKVAESDNHIFEIDFNKTLDTVIDKNNFENHIYQTYIHKRIIE